MAEKIIPDIAFFGQEIIQEAAEDFSEQCTKITDRLINFPPEKISELHLQDWYTEYCFSIFERAARTSRKYVRSN